MQESSPGKQPSRGIALFQTKVKGALGDVEGLVSIHADGVVQYAIAGQGNGVDCAVYITEGVQCVGLAGEIVLCGQHACYACGHQRAVGGSEGVIIRGGAVAGQVHVPDHVACIVQGQIVVGRNPLCPREGIDDGEGQHP